ncbi:MAG: hypothetical protein WBB32_06175 [Flavobacteriales bacterium]
MQLPNIALPLLGLALPLLFVRAPRVKAVSNVLVGTALLFLAIGLLKDNVPPPTADALGFLQSLQGIGLVSNLIFVATGALLALIIQSSGVAVVLTVALCEAGTIGYTTGAARCSVRTSEQLSPPIPPRLRATLGRSVRLVPIC